MTAAPDNPASTRPTPTADFSPALPIPPARRLLPLPTRPPPTKTDILPLSLTPPMALQLKPTDKILHNYQLTLREFRHASIEHESATRSAFQTLLAELARRRAPAPPSALMSSWLAGSRGFDTLWRPAGIEAHGYGLPGVAASIHSAAVAAGPLFGYGLPGVAASIHLSGCTTTKDISYGLPGVAASIHSPVVSRLRASRYGLPGVAASIH